MRLNEAIQTVPQEQPKRYRLDEVMAMETPEVQKSVNRGFGEKVKFFLGESAKALPRAIETVPAQFEALVQVAEDQIRGIAKKQLAEEGAVFGRSIEGRTPEQTARIAENNKIVMNMDSAIDTSKRLQANWIEAAYTGIEAPDPELFRGSFMENPSFTRAVALGIQSVPMLGLAAAITAATKSPTAGAALLGSLEAAEEHNIQRELGGSEGEALGTFVVNTLALSFLESIPLTGFMKGGALPIRAFRGAIQEGSEEVLQSLWKDSVAKIGYDDTRKLTANLVESFIAGAISGGVIGGFSPVAGIQKSMDKASKKGVEVDKMIEAVSKQVTNEADNLTEIIASDSNLDTTEAVAKVSEEVKIEKPTVADITPGKDGKTKLDLKIEELEEKGLIKEQAKEALDFVKEQQKEFKGLIKPHKDGSLKEEFDDIPSKYKSKDASGMTMDEAADQIGISEAELSSYLKNIDSQADRLIETIKENKAKFKKKKEITILKQKVKDIERGIKEGKVLAKKEVKEIQSGIIDFIKKSDLELADQAKFLSTIKNIQTQEQLSKRIGEIIDRVESLEEKATKRTLKAKISKALKQSKPKKQAGKPIGKFGADVQVIMDIARRSLKLNKEQAKIQLDANLAKHQDKGTTPTIEEAIQNRILNIKANFETLTSEELKETLDDIEAIQGAGKAGQLLDLIKRQEKNAENREKAKNVLTGGKEIAKSKAEIRTDADDKFLTRIKQFGRSMSSWNDIMDMLSVKDKTSQIGESELNKMTQVRQTEQKEKGGVRKSVEKVSDVYMKAYDLKTNRQLIRKMNEDSAVIPLGTFIDSEGVAVSLDMSRAQLRKRWMELQDPTLRDTFTEGMSYTEEMINAIENEMSADDMDFANAQLKFYQDYYDSVNEVYKKIYGINLPKNMFYSPITRVVNELGDTDTFFQEQVHRASVTSGSLKSRVENVRPIDVKSDIEVLQRHIIEMEHFKAWAEQIRDLRAIFNNPEIRQTIESLHGRTILEVTDDFIEDFAAGGRNKSTGFAALDRVLNGFRIRFTQSALGLKISLLPKQMVSTIAAMDYVSPIEFTRGLVNFWAHPIQNVKDVTESELWKERGMSVTRDIKDAMQSEEFSAFKKAPNFLNSLMLATKIGDKGAIFVGGWTVYQAELRKTGSKEKALDAFEKFASETQQSADLSQQSQFQRGNSFTKLFTMFTSSQNQYFRKELGAIRNLIAQRIPPAQAAKKIMIYHFVLPMLFQWVASGFRWDDKEQKRAAILGSFNGIFILKDMLDAIVRAGLGMKVFDPSVPILTAGKGAAKAAKLFNADDITNEDIIEAIQDISTGTIGPVTGLPIKQLLNAYEGVLELDDDTGKGIKKMSGWTDFSLQGSTPKTKRVSF